MPLTDIIVGEHTYKPQSINGTQVIRMDPTSPIYRPHTLTIAYSKNKRNGIDRARHLVRFSDSRTEEATGKRMEYAAYAVIDFPYAAELPIGDREFCLNQLATFLEPTASYRSDYLKGIL